MHLFFSNITSFSNHSALKILVFLLLISSISFAQEKKKVEILYAGYGQSNESLAADAQRLVDSVYIRHKEVLMWCDTAYTYSGTNKVDAYGRVHIKQGDTLHLYANAVLYDGDKNLARAIGNVRLINKSTTIYADTLDYDLNNNISYYDDFGTIIDSSTTITSIIGKYFIDTDMIFFYKDVVAINDDVTLKSDTLNYNTSLGRIYINGPTTIYDDENTLYTENGWYDSKTGESELLKHPIISNATQKIAANYIKYNKKNKTGKALGSVRIEDEENRSIILGNVVEYNDSLKTATVTDSAVFITYTEKDTMFLHADTLRTVPDTVEGEKIISAFYGVRFFRNDMQGVCDSLVYFTKDSIIQLYQNPVIWSEIHQISANKIEMIQHANAPDELHLTQNSFIISEQDSNQFDQIKGKEMIGYIRNQELTNIDVNGNGETLYYAKEKEEIIGLNRLESSKILINFLEGKIHKIKFIKAPEGELKPLPELTQEDKELSGFDWKDYLRPVSKHDIFEQRVPFVEETIEKEEILEK